MTLYRLPIIPLEGKGETSEHIKLIPDNVDMHGTFLE